MPGTLCVCYCNAFGAMFRAVITDIVEDRVEVLYVDYGNYEVVDRKQLKSIDGQVCCILVHIFSCRFQQTSSVTRTFPDIRRLSPEGFFGNSAFKSFLGVFDIFQVGRSAIDLKYMVSNVDEKDHGGCSNGPAVTVLTAVSRRSERMRRKAALVRCFKRSPR